MYLRIISTQDDCGALMEIATFSPSPHPSLSPLHGILRTSKNEKNIAQSFQQSLFNNIFFGTDFFGEKILQLFLCLHLSNISSITANRHPDQRILVQSTFGICHIPTILIDSLQF